MGSTFNPIARPKLYAVLVFLSAKEFKERIYSSKENKLLQEKHFKSLPPELRREPKNTVVASPESISIYFMKANDNANVTRQV